MTQPSVSCYANQTVRLLWLIALLACVQVNGTLPILATAFDAVTCPPDCDGDPEDHCSPLCPGCLCVHSARPVAISPAALSDGRLPPLETPRAAPENRRTPESLPVGGVFHPPTV